MHFSGGIFRADPLAISAPQSNKFAFLHLCGFVAKGSPVCVHVCVFSGHFYIQPIWRLLLYAKETFLWCHGHTDDATKTCKTSQWLCDFSFTFLLTIKCMCRRKGLVKQVAHFIACILFVTNRSENMHLHHMHSLFGRLFCSFIQIAKFQEFGWYEQIFR